MATVADSIQRLELHSGDHMSREEFHRLYSQMPPGFRAELVGGVVYVPSPLKRTHGLHHVALGGVVTVYAAQTPGVEAADNATVQLGDDAEPQPDLSLRILPECGGQSRTTLDDYISGAPEMLVEVALSSRSIDLYDKRNDYERYGVCEYIVVCLHEQKLRAFDLTQGIELSVDEDGVYRSRVFPGLWIDERALFSQETAHLLETVRRGLATPEHAEFVARLEARRPH